MPGPPSYQGRHRTNTEHLGNDNRHADDDERDGWWARKPEDDGVAVQAAGQGQVRVAVHAAGVNFPDTLIIQDKYQFKPPRPFAPGHEVAGDIVEVGEGVTGYKKKGDRVIGAIGSGGYATEAVIDQGQLQQDDE